MKKKERKKRTAAEEKDVAYNFLRVANRMHFGYGFSNLLLAKNSNRNYVEERKLLT